MKDFCADPGVPTFNLDFFFPLMRFWNTGLSERRLSPAIACAQRTSAATLQRVPTTPPGIGLSVTKVREDARSLFEVRVHEVDRNPRLHFHCPEPFQSMHLTAGTFWLQRFSPPCKKDTAQPSQSAIVLKSVYIVCTAVLGTCVAMLDVSTV